MKSKKLITFVMALSLALTTPISFAANVTQVEAATVSLSNKKLTLEVGKTKILAIKGTTNQAKWVSSDKKVATVSKTGKVTAIAEGTATITATVKADGESQKITCKVNITSSGQTGSTKKIKFGPISLSIPKTYKTTEVPTAMNTTFLMILPKDATQQSSSNINVVYQETGVPAMGYELIQSTITQLLTKETLESSLQVQIPDAKIKNFKVSDYESKIGKCVKITYDVTTASIPLSQTMYYVSIDDYVIQVVVTDINEGLKPDIQKVGQDILDSIK